MSAPTLTSFAAPKGAVSALRAAVQALSVKAYIGDKDVSRDQGLGGVRKRQTEVKLDFRSILALVALVFAAGGTARAQEAGPADSAVWKKVHASVFGSAKLEAADAVIVLDTPKRAEDAAIVPLAIRARFPQAKDRYIERIWLIIDNNPSPIAAVFNFTLESGRADIETRVRIEEYTYVRAVALTNDGKLYMAANYVKASGGCSAPAGKDAIAARANLGKMRLRVSDGAESGRPAIAQLMISHPNDSGLAMDQVTRSYATPHFVRRIEVRYGGKLVMNADVDFSISENPNFRFYFIPEGEGELDAKVVDNQDLEFTAHTKLDSARLGLVSTPR
jgi:sulfur-oxidizing protein SoxY